MFRLKWKYLILVVVLAGALTMGGSQADAFWGGYGWHGGSCWGCGPYYSYSSWYSPYWSSGYGNWYAGVRSGPMRRTVFRPYRWYRGGWGWGCCNRGCYCTSCYVGSCCDPCCGGEASASAPVGNGPTPTPALNKPTPAEPQPVLPENSAPQTNYSPAEDAGLLTIWVPVDAEVFINGMQTKSTGAMRQYVSRGLKPGNTYKYEVRATVQRDGQVVEDTQTILLSASAERSIAFRFDAGAAEKLATTR